MRYLAKTLHTHPGHKSMYERQSICEAEVKYTKYCRKLAAVCQRLEIAYKAQANRDGKSSRFSEIGFKFVY